MKQHLHLRGLFLSVLILLVAACSPKKLVANQFGNAISGSSSVYLSDNDPDLVREAIPFGLKTYEGLLDVTPNHKGVLLSAASGFTSYAYLLQDEAERIDADDYRGAMYLRKRAANLYIRGRDYAFRGLDLDYPDFHARLAADPDATLAETTADDVAFLYWAGASWGGALSAAKDDADLIAALPYAGAMVLRVVELEPGFSDGSAYEYLVNYETSRPGGDVDVARGYYEQALALSNGQRASVYLAWAEGVSVQNQDLAEFRSLLALALAVDPDAVLDQRLVNTMAIRRAVWLEDSIPDLFFEVD